MTRLAHHLLATALILACASCSSKSVPVDTLNADRPVRYFELKDSSFKGDLGFAIREREGQGPISDELILREGTFYRDSTELHTINSTASEAPHPTHARYNGVLFRERPLHAGAPSPSPDASPLHAPKGVLIVAIDGFEHENLGFVFGLRNRATTDDDDLRAAAYFRSEDELVQLLNDHAVPPEMTIIVEHVDCFRPSALSGFERGALPKVRARAH